MMYHVLYTYCDPLFVNRKLYVVCKIILKYIYYTINQFSQPIKYSEFVLNDHDHEYIFISKYDSQKIRETK